MHFFLRLLELQIKESQIIRNDLRNFVVTKLVKGVFFFVCFFLVFSVNLVEQNQNELCKYKKKNK